MIRYSPSVLVVVSCAASLVVATGCCPIPVPRTATLVPETRVIVWDGETGEPIADAKVRLERHQIGPPPGSFEDSYETRTDEAGRAYFEEKEETERTAPLMMHGVPHREWAVCIRHDDYETVYAPDRVSEDGGTVDEPFHTEVKLQPGESSPCKDYDDDSSETIESEDTGVEGH